MGKKSQKKHESKILRMVAQALEHGGSIAHEPSRTEDLAFLHLMTTSDQRLFETDPETSKSQALSSQNS
jgi:hypothetical protein